MKKIYWSFVTCIMLGWAAHSQDKTYQLAPGQAFDLLLFNTNEGTEETQKKYFSSAVAVATEYGFMPQKGLRVNEAPLQGNYKPGVIIVGLWKDYEKRHAFVEEIVQRVPDFHEMRREIWSPFFLTYWKVKEAQTFVIKEDGFYVMTAHWMQEDQSLSTFSTQWMTELEAQGGKLVVALRDGTSPYGYLYDPDLLTISSWENREAFERFQRAVKDLEQQHLKHINQFVIE